MLSASLNKTFPFLPRVLHEKETYCSVAHWYMRSADARTVHVGFASEHQVYSFHTHVCDIDLTVNTLLWNVLTV